jgi:hypothetical protein
MQRDLNERLAGNPHVAAVEGCFISAVILLIFAALMLILALTSCGPLPTASNFGDDAETYEYWWNEAIELLAKKEVPRGAMGRLSWTRFAYRKHEGLFYCGNVLTAGCYSPSSGVIQWTVTEAYVLRHEYGHAILHKLDYRCWRDFQEEDKRCP